MSPISHKTIFLKIVDNSCFYFGFDNKSVLDLTKRIRRNQNLEEPFLTIVKLSFLFSRMARYKRDNMSPIW